jgi:hypothetical protein
MKPPRSILSPEFKYKNAAETDIAATFRRIRREQKAVKDAEQAALAEQRDKVRQIVYSRGGK